MVLKGRLLAAIGLLLVVGGCNQVQSTLAPAGPHADKVAHLSWVMIIGGMAIFLFVMLRAAAAILLPARYKGWMRGRGFVVGLGIAFPIVTLSALLVWGLSLTRVLDDGTEPALRVEVVGAKWWWRVRYLGPDGDVLLTTANQINLPVGRSVEFLLKTEDVIHSFWVPVLAGKLDMIPGRTNVIRFSADKPGIYRGQCAEYCGEQHALMGFDVIALDQEDFYAWWARAAGTPPVPTTPQQVAGRAVFHDNGCGGCHTVRGTDADGTIGPDLTNVGGRVRLAASSFPNNVGTLAGWVASAQHLKPGNGMPSFDRLTGPELRAVATYLEGLK